MLDPTAVITPNTPEFWMNYMASRLLDRNRTVRLATLAAYRAGCPPLPMIAASDRKGFYHFTRLSRTNMARKVISACGDRMKVRSIRTAAADDDLGDEVAIKYWRSSGLDVISGDVHSDMLTFSEAYVRVSLRPDGSPVALRRDPRFCIGLPDPLDPLRIHVGFELLWDEFSMLDYAFLWIREPDGNNGFISKQYVASAPRTLRPRSVSIPGITSSEASRFGWWWPQLSFEPSKFTMRPDMEAVPEADRDGGPYSQTLQGDRVPLVRFDNKDDVGEYEEHLDVLDRINRTILARVITSAVQAYKQRALQQEVPATGAVVDRLASKDAQGNKIDWGELFQPGPDALWKLPPGVKIWESGETDLKPLLAAAQDDIKTLSAVTDTPLPLLSDDVNQSAEGAQFRREGLVFRVEDRNTMAGRKWSEVIALMFYFAPDSDRYETGVGSGNKRLDRADAAEISVDWAPAERFSLAERADADAKNKTLSVDMSAEIVWGLTPAQVARNRAQRKADIAELPALYRLSQLPANLAENEAPPVPTTDAGAPAAAKPPAATPPGVANPAPEPPAPAR